MNEFGGQVLLRNVLGVMLRKLVPLVAENAEPTLRVEIQGTEGVDHGLASASQRLIF